MLSGTAQMGKAEELLAELAEATFRVARRNDFKSALIDIELDLWRLRAAENRERQPLAVPEEV